MNIFLFVALSDFLEFIYPTAAEITHSCLSVFCSVVMNSLPSLNLCKLLSMSDHNFVQKCMKYQMIFDQM